MKRFVYPFIFLFYTGFYGQGNPNGNIGSSDLDSRSTAEFSPTPIFDAKGGSDEGIMDKTFAENEVKSEKFKGLSNVSPGYYVIANVFRNSRYLNTHLRKIRKNGFGDGGTIFNEATGLNYLYLQKFDRWEDALGACTSNFNGEYTKDKWIMIVQAAADYVQFDGVGKEMPGDEIPLEDVTYDLLMSLKENETPVKGNTLLYGSPTIWRADEYFNKMWYAEAAQLYERALERNPDNYGKEILQKAGDAHYFNTNMDRAYFWYQKLYDRYGNEIHPDHLFRYTHSMKGAGKLAKAKRLLRDLDGKTAPINNVDGYSTEMVTDGASSGKVDLRNLSINSQYSDFAPMFYMGDEIVYSSARSKGRSNTRRYKWTDQPFLDLYVAKIADGSQELEHAAAFPDRVNTKYHEAVVTFTPDYNTMYFTRNNYDKELKRDQGGSNNLKIYVSKKINGKWGKAKELPFNNDRYSMGHPALSPDGKKLYFISDMPGSMGDTDIFVVDILGEDLYSRPKNLGPGINTVRKEMFPFATDGKLYFSSNGRAGYGGLDVYGAVWDEEGGFKEVTNLGMPINSERDDFSYIVAENSDRGYFASNRKGGKGDDDLYSFERQKPETVIKSSISGRVNDHISGAPIANALVRLLDGQDIIKEQFSADDGSFDFGDLEPTAQHSVEVTKEAFFENTILIPIAENKEARIEVPMKRLEEMIVLENGVRKLKTDKIYFDFDKSHLGKDASSELDKLVTVMKEYKNMVIKIESHTDSRGVAQYNQDLSDKRARSTRDYILSKGISPDRIESALGYGETQLINECRDAVPCSRQAHEDNRRSEFIIVRM